MSAEPGPVDLLGEGLARLAVPDAERAQAQLNLYLDELLRWNPRFGFVKASSRRELIVKHVLDSLSAWRLIRDEAGNGGVLDVGSGAGLPGIPLAVCMPETPFTLLERSAKKVSFLRTCKALLGLARVEVIQGDLTAVAARFDVVTFRAVAPLSRFLADARDAGLKFRTVVAYKGRIERAQAEIEYVRRSADAPARADVVPVTVPFLDEERCIVALRP
ncbi:MAG: 16S rRNA (guanine(527)-N(7))-methyltransferase RsmG [Spirochaetia bacterium]|jgi:16S rRNA (guanine527-N7)-methyltransferase